MAVLFPVISSLPPSHCFYELGGGLLFLGALVITALLLGVDKSASDFWKLLYPQDHLFQRGSRDGPDPSNVRATH